MFYLFILIPILIVILELNLLDISLGLHLRSFEGEVSFLWNPKYLDRVNVLKQWKVFKSENSEKLRLSNELTDILEISLILMTHIVYRQLYTDLVVVDQPMTEGVRVL